MGRYRVIKNSLLGGQISRDAVGRNDLPQYAHACELLQNMIPLLSGGAYRRPGSMFQDFIPANTATPTSPNAATGVAQSSPPRLFPFIVSNQLAYAIAIGTMRWSDQAGGPQPGGGYMKYYRATGNTNAAFESAYTYGQLPYRCKSISPVATSGTYQCIYDRQGGPGAVANSGSTPEQNPILDVADSLQTYDDDVWSVQYCQANDVMFLTHPDYQPQVIWLAGTDDLQAHSYDYGLTGLALAQSRPYLNQNTTAATMAFAFSGSGPTGVLTCSTPFFQPLHGQRNGCVPESPFDIQTDGAIIAIAVETGESMTGNNTDSGILFLYVTAVTSTTTANVTALNGIPSRYSSGTALTEWWESAWSNYRGWPGACGIYQQRLCFASTIHQPSSLWFTATTAYGAPVSELADSTSCKFSALGDGPNQGLLPIPGGTLANGQPFAATPGWCFMVTDDSPGDGQATGPIGAQPFRISLATSTLDSIKYLSPDQQLFLATATQEWICAPVNGSFDVANVTCTIQSHYGSDLVQAIRIGYELMFVLQNKNEVRAYQYNYFDQSFFGEPVQLMFDEYPSAEEGTLVNSTLYAGRRKYRQIDWDATRSVLWCVDTAGNFFGLTRDRKLAITAWHTHQLGGFNAAHGSGQNLSDGLTPGNSYTDAANFLCDGSVTSICSTPNPLSGIRDIWMVVKRSYGTSNETVWSVERMVGANTVRESAYSDIAPGNAQEPLYVDCAYFLTDNNNPTDYAYNIGFNGASQLTGQTVIGTYYSEAWGIFALTTQAPVDATGNFSLQTNLPADYGDPFAPHTMVVGLGYNSAIKPVRVDPPSQIGTSQGTVKRNSKAYLKLFKTLMLKMGGAPNPYTGYVPILEQIRFEPSVEMGQSPEIYTGTKEVFLPTNFDRDGYVYILQDQPLPFTLVSFALEGTEYEQ